MNHNLNICKIADAIDFFHSEIIENIFKTGEKPRLHLKQWEYAQVLRGAYISGKYNDKSIMLGLGCGQEKTIPILAQAAKRVYVTDLYSENAQWDVAKGNAAQLYSTSRNIKVLNMDMRNISFENNTFDFIWSICALEHIGTPEEILNTLNEIYKVLKPDGVPYVHHGI